MPSPALQLQDPPLSDAPWAPAQPPLHTPVPFGHWFVAGNTLLCRQPARTVTVRAPGKLLRDLAGLCDGMRPWRAVADALGASWDDDAVAAFMQGLARESVLVESRRLWAHWSDIAQVPQPVPVGGTPEELAQLALRAEQRLLPGTGAWEESVRNGHNAVAAGLRQRESVRTFDDRALSLQVLCSILWAAHGVARRSEVVEPRWHRTVASAGSMHSARWFVAVLRPLPSTNAADAAAPPGIYEARFHVGGGASLHAVAGEARHAWHCLRDPRVLRYASALVLPLYDVTVPAVKYGNRATLFALLEAGLSLQNAQSMAGSLGAACMLRGDTVSTEAIALAGVAQEGGHWLSVPGLVVGAMPTPEQKRKQRSDLRFNVVPNLQPRCAAAAGRSLFAFAASLQEGEGSVQLAGSGRAADPGVAMSITEAEAWERLGWATLGPTTPARYDEVPGALDPRTLVAYSARQHRSPDFPFARFDPARMHLWSQAVDSDTGDTHALPAECVHLLQALPVSFQENACTASSTSGVAAGLNLGEALTRAAIELVERDAFCRAWLSRIAAPGVTAASLPGDLQRRIAALALSGAKACFIDLSTPWCTVLAVFLQSPALPFTAITAAAGFDAEATAAKALSEAEGRLAFAEQRSPDSSGQGPMRAIDRYYRDPRTFRRSDFFLPAQATRRFDQVGMRAARTWEQMRGRLRAEGFKVLAADITPAGAAIHQGRKPVKVVRAVVPGLLPIWFQAGLQPAGLRRFHEARGEKRGRTAGPLLPPFT